MGQRGVIPGGRCRFRPLPERREPGLVTAAPAFRSAGKAACRRPGGRAPPGGIPQPVRSGRKVGPAGEWFGDAREPRARACPWHPSRGTPEADRYTQQFGGFASGVPPLVGSGSEDRAETGKKGGTASLGNTYAGRERGAGDAARPSPGSLREPPSPRRGEGWRASASAAEMGTVLLPDGEKVARSAG